MNGVSTRLRLRVSPGSGRTLVVGRHGEAWKVRVGAPPEGGGANEAVLSLLADTLSLPRAAVRLVSGRSSRDKIIELGGIAPADTERRLASAAATGEGRKDRRR